MRAVLQLLLLLLPFALYALYLSLVRRKQATDPAWREAPWAWLTVSGLALVIVSFLVLGYIGGDPIGGTYTPARAIDGKIVPGEVKR